jgi:hypothetical protein
MSNPMMTGPHTLTPPNPPAAPVPAPPSPFRYLVSDTWILISWIVLVTMGGLSAMVGVAAMGAHPVVAGTQPSATMTALSHFLSTGYEFWALYFGMPASWRFTRRAGRRLFGVGCFSGAALLWLAIALTLCFVYSLMGGGVYQFARRWWLLAHGQQPPFPATS